LAKVGLNKQDPESLVGFGQVLVSRSEHNIHIKLDFSCRNQHLSAVGDGFGSGEPRRRLLILTRKVAAASQGDRGQADAPEVASGQAARLPVLIEAARRNGADLVRRP
jgi:hypothetical protein